MIIIRNIQACHKNCQENCQKSQKIEKAAAVVSRYIPLYSVVIITEKRNKAQVMHRK